MPLVALECSRCGAALPATRPGESCACPYCGQTYAFDAAATPAPQSPRGRKSAWPAVVVVGGVLAAIGIGIGSAVNAVVHVARVRSTPSLARPADSATGPTTAAADERFLWDSVGGPPQIAEVAGRELLVARFREGDGDQLYLEAREPPKLTRVWRVGPFGSYAEGYRATFFQLAGDRVAVTDVRAKIHVYDLATGAELGTFPLSDRPTRDGLRPMRDGRLLVATSDGNRWLLDPKIPALTRAGKGDRALDDCGREGLFGKARPCANPTAGAPGVPGFQPRRVLTAKGVGVAVGHRVPGTRVPRAVGFTPGAGAILWTADLAATDPTMAEETSGEDAEILEGGRLVASFHQGDGYRLGAFDARDGRRLWEVPVPKAWKAWPPQLVAGEGYCYLLCAMGLAAIDPANGRVVGALSPFKLDD